MDLEDFSTHAVVHIDTDVLLDPEKLLFRVSQIIALLVRDPVLIGQGEYLLGNLIVTLKPKVKLGFVHNLLAGLRFPSDFIPTIAAECAPFRGLGSTSWTNQYSTSAFQYRIGAVKEF
jgi:hypothetical protein